MAKHKDEREGLPSVSDFDIRLRCLRERTRERELGLKKEDTPESLSGTRIHHYLEGKEVKLEGDEKERAEAIRDYRNKLLTKFGFDDSILETEKRYWRLGLFGDKLWSARIDCLAHNKDVCLVMNYKSGFSQLLKASNSLQSLGETIVVSDYIESKEYYGTFINQFGYDLVKYTKQDLVREGNRIDSLVKQSRDPSSPYSTGYIQCLYCPVRKAGGCPAQNNTIEVSQIQKDIGFTAHQISQLSPIQKRDLFDKVKIAKKLLQDMEKDLTERAHKGEIPDYESREISRRMVDASPLEIANIIGVDKDVLLKECSINLEAIDKLKLSDSLEKNGMIKRTSFKKLFRK